MIDITPGIARLKALIDGEKHMNLAKAAQYLEAANLQEEDLLPYADFDHPASDGYGRKMASETDNYEIMVMSWNPGDISAVHDHGYTAWGAVQVFGNTLHHTFTTTNNSFRISRKEILVNREIVKVNNSLIHQMGNVTSKPYFTVHIYGNNELKGNITADSRIFELESGLIKHTTGGAFINLPDELVYDIEKLPETDYQTLVHQSAILIQYYQRYPSETAEYLTRAIIDKLAYCHH
jgi:cysteine dioxygenase